MGKDSAFRRQCAEISRQRRPVFNCCTILIIIVCLAGGSRLIVAHSWYAVLGIPLLAEAMILSAYLRHECAHLLVFKTKRNNVILGEILSCITGDLPSRFIDFRKAHLRHHSEQVDLIGFDLAEVLEKYTRFGRAAILMLEACYIPIIFLIVRADGVCSGLCSTGYRMRTILSMGITAAIYIALAVISPFALSLYLSAVITKIHCIRFVDAFQHNYDQIPESERVRPRGWIYEQRNTFSFPVLKRNKVLNFLLLNFGFHNAHHAAPGCPWYNLPRIDQALRQHLRISNALDATATLHQEIGIGLLLRAYLRNRVKRITKFGSAVPVQSGGPLSAAAFIGTFTDNLLG